MTQDQPADRPAIRLAPGRHKRAEQGHPWIYSNEIILDAAAKALPSGSIVTALTSEGRRLGVAMFNPRSLISLRLLDRDPGRSIDRRFFSARIGRALAIREKLFSQPYYRLVHAEADGLPGLIIDRYGDALVCQFNTAGISRAESNVLAALQEVLKPELVVLRNDSGSRTLEGLDSETRIVVGAINEPITLMENGCRFFADLSGGQKTGWFYDQRPNRAFIAHLSKGAKVLDAYSFTGGFGIQAAVAGASEVMLLDRSEAALKLAEKAASSNDVAAICKIRRGEVFEELARLNTEKERFDIVVLDPPAFVKSRKDLGPGSRGYRKMVQLGAALVARGGYMLAASCSHNMPIDAFGEAVRQGIFEAGRTARVLHIGGAGPDHPLHQALPESAYLKAIILALD